MRSALRPSGSSHQRTISQEMSAMPTSETVYTFSFTTDWFHTVNAVAPMSAASAPPAMRCQRSANQLDEHALGDQEPHARPRPRCRSRPAC